MNTYVASKHGAEDWRAGTREWVFGLLPNRRYRKRSDLLSGLELRRRPDCEPTLRALVVEDWTPETLHHFGWCDSCRIGGFGLGIGAPGAVRRAPRRRRALWLALAAGIAIAAPLAASQLIDDPLGQQQEVRGGLALPVPKAVRVVPVPRTKRVVVTLVVSHKRSVLTARGQRALPLTT
jgi:hypothetical protein